MAQIQARDSQKDDVHLLKIRNAINAWREKPRSNMTGISNQGATCYLNTLLQTLLHTPDLTSRLFTMAKATEPTRLKRIVQELLVLFYNLLQGTGEPVSAKPLTDSFGWRSDEVMVHQDIQELNRLLFEQLENNLNETSEKTLISDLYKGVLRTRIKCLKCGRVSERNDEFQDVNLSVIDSNSVEEALRNHTQTERLSGDNQYFCERCKCRVDATKTSRFTELPPILTLSLSRFYFDGNTMEACKLDKMCSFPILLNMTDYLSANQKEPVTYDLFSIVIHVGAAACGGHYHAYIKDPYGYTGKSSNNEQQQQQQQQQQQRKFNISEWREPKSRISKTSQTNTNNPYICYHDNLSHSSSSTNATAITSQRIRAQSHRRALQPHLMRTDQSATTSAITAGAPIPVQYKQHQSLPRHKSPLFQPTQATVEMSYHRRPGRNDNSRGAVVTLRSGCAPCADKSSAGTGRRPPMRVPPGLLTMPMGGCAGIANGAQIKARPATSSSQTVSENPSRRGPQRGYSALRRHGGESVSPSTLAAGKSASTSKSGSWVRQRSAHTNFFRSMKATIVAQPLRPLARPSSTVRLSNSTRTSQTAEPAVHPSPGRCPSRSTPLSGSRVRRRASPPSPCRQSAILMGTSRTSSDCTIDIEASDKSDWWEPRPNREAFTTSLNNKTNEDTTIKQDGTQPEKSTTPKDSANPVWQSRLFAQTGAPSPEHRVSTARTTDASLTSSLSSTPGDDARVPSQTPLMHTKDSLALNEHRRHNDSSGRSSTLTGSTDGSMKTRKGECSGANIRETASGSDRCCTPQRCAVPMPCSALRMTRGDRTAGNPVVYGKWFDFNDDVVSEVQCESFERVFKGVECAYMLFYKKTGQSSA